VALVTSLCNLITTRPSWCKYFSQFNSVHLKVFTQGVREPKLRNREAFQHRRNQNHRKVLSLFSVPHSKASFTPLSVGGAWQLSWFTYGNNTIRRSFLIFNPLFMLFTTADSFVLLKCEVVSTQEIYYIRKIIREGNQRECILPWKRLEIGHCHLDFFHMQHT